MEENHQEKSLGEILVAWFRSEGVTMDDRLFIQALDLTIANAVSDALKQVNGKIVDVNNENRNRHACQPPNPSAAASADMTKPTVAFPASDPAPLAPLTNNSPQVRLGLREEGRFKVFQAKLERTTGKAPT